MNTLVARSDLESRMDEVFKKIDSSNDVLIYHVTDVLELLRILTRNKIEAANELKATSSFTLYPQIADGVTLYTPSEARLYLSSGFLIVFDRSQIASYYLPQSQLFTNASRLHVGGIRGELNLSETRAEFISALSLSCTLEHPLLTNVDLHAYALTRNIQAKDEFGIVLPAVPDRYYDFDVSSYQAGSHKVLVDYIFQNSSNLLRHDVNCDIRL